MASILLRGPLGRASSSLQFSSPLQRGTAGHFRAAAAAVAASCNTVSSPPHASATPPMALQRRCFHATAPPAAQMRWFRRLFRRKGNVNIAALAAKAEQLPEDLQLPKAASPGLRLMAGAMDLTTAALTGGLASQLCLVAGLGQQNAVTAAYGMALLYWLVRDRLADGGNRSFGKKACRLEIAQWDGTLISRETALIRNSYYAILPLAALHPMLGVTAMMLGVFDVTSFLFSTDRRKVGDYLSKGYVVAERQGRADRLVDMEETEEVRA